MLLSILFLFILDCEDHKEYEKKYLVRSIRRIIRDYQIVCENYVQAIKTAPLKKIEAIDVGRRSIHDEGAELLRGHLSSAVAMDQNTARRLFTLMCILHIRA